MAPERPEPLQNIERLWSFMPEAALHGKGAWATCYCVPYRVDPTLRTVLPLYPRPLCFSYHRACT
jgi:hypothetical protein